MSSDSHDGLPAVSGSLMGLSMIAVGLRFYARSQQKARFLWDDWTVLIALITYIGGAITTFIARHYKVLGYNVTDEDAAELELSSKLQLALDVFPTVSIAFVKLSALYFYRRVFCVGGPSNKWFDIATLATVVVVLLHLVAFLILTFLQCGTHLSALWDGNYLQYCTISFPWLYGLTISDFLLDVWILALPIPLILKLHASTSRKLSISGVFLLAFVGLGASIARMVELIKDEQGGPTYYVTHDQEHIITSYLFYVMLENGMALVAVNLPSLWFLVTSGAPEQLVRSVRSVIELFSMNSRRSSGRTANSTKETKVQGHSERGMSAGSGRDSQNLVPAPDAMRTDLESQKFETFTADEMEMGERKGASKDGARVQHTVELRRD